MTRLPFTRRYWNSLTGAVPGVVTSTKRTRDGYSFWERYWASLTVGTLPPRPTQGTGGTRRFAPTAIRSREWSIASLPKGSWFSLPPVPAAIGLRASDDDDVLVTAISEGGLEFFVRRSHGIPARYRVEVVVRQNAELPALVRIRYPTATGQRVLLVPVAVPQFGAAASQIDLPGLESGTPWEASGPEPVAGATEWEVSAVSDSIQAAASEVTRNAWRAVRDAARGDLQAVIDRALL